MGWFFRKSANLGGGVRLNFSKSGIGVSGGARGFRVSTGPRGTYVNMGRNGVYYRKKIGAPTANRAPSDGHQPSGYAQPDDEAIDLSSAQTLNQINYRLSQPAYCMPLSAFVAFACLLATAVSLWLAVGVAGALAYPLYLVYVDDMRRRSYALHYAFDESRKREWLQLCDALHELGKCDSLWRISSQADILDPKRNAGASINLNRSLVRLAACQPPLLESNVLPYCLDLGTEKLFFLPDKVYVHSAGRYSGLEYGQCSITASAFNFIEAASPPRDASVAGTTWRYVNKDGTPDRRFAVNPQLLIAAYVKLTIAWAGGAQVVLLASRQGAQEKLIALFPASRTSGTGRPNAGTAGNARRDTSAGPPGDGHSDSTGRSYSSSPRGGPAGGSQAAGMRQPRNCYEMLGLEQGCTKEQAAAAYRELARQYHPDLVSNMAPEIRQLAELRMKEINGAYMEIRSLRGW